MGATKVLITGATGSFGQIFLLRWLAADPEVTIVAFSRDEHKQYMLYHTLLPAQRKRVQFMLGDVRDLGRLQEAMNGAAIVVHTAALKQVQWAEQNPEEVWKTNVLGTENIIQAAVETGVQRVFHISTDKAVNPVGVYGRSKQEAEIRVLHAATAYSDTKFSILRYGNLVGSRGSVIPLLINKQKNEVLQFTDPGMTRFHATADDAWALLAAALDEAANGEILIPKLPAYRLADLALAFGGAQSYIGARPGEKAYEELLSEAEAQLTRDYGSYFVLNPTIVPGKGNIAASCYAYNSQNPCRWLTVKELVAAIEVVKTTAQTH